MRREWLRVSACPEPLSVRALGSIRDAVARKAAKRGSAGRVASVFSRFDGGCFCEKDVGVGCPHAKEEMPRSADDSSWSRDRLAQQADGAMRPAI